MSLGVPEALRQCYNSSLKSDLTVPTRTTTNCQMADSRSDPWSGSDNERTFCILTTTFEAALKRKISGGTYFGIVVLLAFVIWVK